MNRRNIITSALALVAGLFARPTKAAQPTSPPTDSYWSRPRDEYALFVEDMSTKYKNRPPKQHYSQRLMVVHHSDVARLTSMRADRYWRKEDQGWLTKELALQDLKLRKKLPHQQVVITLDDLKQAI